MQKYTLIYDMHSGGDRKTDYQVIFIKGTEEEAQGIFEDKFNIPLYHITCECCGQDFDIWEFSEDKLEEMMEIHSNKETVIIGE